MPEYTPEQFSAYLLSVAAKAPAAARDLVDDSSKNVRDGARRNATVANPVHARGVVKHINYDVDAAGQVVEGDIGYDKRGQGNLGAILEYANGDTRNAPQRNLGRAMDVEEPRFHAAAATLGERLLDGR